MPIQLLRRQIHVTTAMDTDQLIKLGRSVQEGSKVGCVVTDAGNCICLQLAVQFCPCSCSPLH